MEFSIKAGSPEKQKTDCVVVGVFEPRRLSDAAKALDRATKGYLNAILRQGDLGRQARFHAAAAAHSGHPLSGCCWSGLGKQEDFGARQYREAVRASVRALADSGAADAVLYLAELPVKDRDAAWNALQLAVVAADASYRFDR